MKAPGTLAIAAARVAPVQARARNRLANVRPAVPDLETAAPYVVGLAILAGMAFALAITPIGSGDYGQWLMTSRAVLGEPVPGYRDLSDVPPIIPILLAAARSVTGDPMLSLHLVGIALLTGLGLAFVALGTLVTRSAWGGALALLIGLIVTDRFMNLFAFGGLLQLGATVFAAFAVAAMIRGARDPLESRRWAWLAAGALAACTLTHVATSLIAVPLGLILALGIAASALVRARWDVDLVRSRLTWPAAAFAAVGLLWLITVLPASGDYVSNPASLAYRGPDRLWGDLFERWPTALVVVIGSGSLVLGAINATLRRRLDGVTLVAAWAAITWALLGWSLLSGSATDYPRFATPILAPLVVGTALAALWAIRTLAAALADAGARTPRDLLVGVAVVAATLVAGPLAIDRHVRQAEFYELRDVDALTAAAAWLDEALPPGSAVLADVREAKWIEGLTGHPGLFSQSVRYAFRPIEWQRSVDADTILRSTGALTSGAIGAMFVTAVDVPGATPRVRPVPTGVVIQANHGGETLDLLRFGPADVTIDSVDGRQLAPMRSVASEDEHQASLRTVWTLPGTPGFSFTQTATVFVDGTTLRLVQDVPGHVVSTRLTEAFGMEMQVIDLQPEMARVCFREVGAGPPCLELRTADGEGEFRAAPDGGVVVTSTPSGQVELLVTALTAGDASVGLGWLDPAELADRHDVRAALIAEADPAYGARAARLEALGFEPSRRFGPYRLLVRDVDPATATMAP